jgi:arginyl-tRNA synthetase
MTFKGQKMSSRLGGVPSAEEVINLVLEEVKSKSENNKGNIEKLKDLSLQEIENLQKDIALSALRISILRSKPGVNIDFDPEKATSFEGDSGPYLCYTHARCCSLLGKYSDMVSAVVCPSPTLSYREEVVPSLLTESVSDIERKVLQFNNILKVTAEELAPQKLVKYLFEVAGEFNNFYAHNKIIDESDEQKTRENIYLVNLVKETLKTGLYILGIDAPEKM